MIFFHFPPQTRLVIRLALNRLCRFPSQPVQDCESAWSLRQNLGQGIAGKPEAIATSFAALPPIQLGYPNPAALSGFLLGSSAMLKMMLSGRAGSPLTPAIDVWQDWKVGTLRFGRATNRLTIRPLSVAGRHVMDLREVRLKWVGPE